MIVVRKYGRGQLQPKVVQPFTLVAVTPSAFVAEADHKRFSCQWEGDKIVCRSEGMVQKFADIPLELLEAAYAHFTRVAERERWMAAL